MKKRIARILIEGVIEKENENYNQKWLLETIEELTDDKKTAGIILYINSPGGGVYQSDEVYLALKKYKEKAKKPVWAYFASLAASGGYYIGCAARAREPRLRRTLLHGRLEVHASQPLFGI